MYLCVRACVRACVCIYVQVKTVVSWEERRLLIAEIEFLTKYYRRTKLVVYVGSTHNTLHMHILILVYMHVPIIHIRVHMHMYTRA